MPMFSGLLRLLECSSEPLVEGLRVRAHHWGFDLNQPKMFPRSSIIDLGMSQHHIYLKVNHGCLFE